MNVRLLTKALGEMSVAANVRFRIASVLVFLLAVSLLPGEALADDAALGRAGSNVIPVYNVPVRMVKEKVTTNLRTNEVDAVFTFVNDGPDADILMGFPMLKEEPYSPDRGEEKKPYFGYQSFRVTEILPEGLEKPYATEEKAGLKPPGGEFFSKWVVWTVPFKSGETKRIRNTYIAEYAYRNSIGENQLEYVLSTGATWKGTIGRAEINVLFDGVPVHKVLSAYPHGYTVTPEGIHWVFEDFEPVEEHNKEIKVVTRDGYDAYLKSDQGLREQLEGRADAAEFLEIRRALDKGDSTQIISACEQALPKVPPVPLNTAPTEEASRRLEMRSLLLSTLLRHQVALKQHRQVITTAKRYYEEARTWPQSRQHTNYALYWWIVASRDGGLAEELKQAARQCAIYGVSSSVMRLWAQSSAGMKIAAPLPPVSSWWNRIWLKADTIIRGPTLDLVSEYGLEDTYFVLLESPQQPRARRTMPYQGRLLIDVLYGLARSRPAEEPTGDLLYNLQMGSVMLEVRPGAVRVSEVHRGWNEIPKKTPDGKWYSPSGEFWKAIDTLRLSLR